MSQPAPSLVIKRGIDLVCALTAVLLLSPVLLSVAVATLITDGRPVFYRQVRVGRFGVPFQLSKIRTMRETYSQDGELLPDGRRVTRLGRLLRRFRLDELPAFVLVLRGSMSMVGPRPLPATVLAEALNTSERNAVRPGFTGLAQISGNTLLSNQEKVALDLYYVRHRSDISDLAIMVKTVGTLLRGERRDELMIERALNEFDTVTRSSTMEQGLGGSPNRGFRDSQVN